jgi:glycosyltransferase involved in cell wall biosynthesis
LLTRSKLAFLFLFDHLTGVIVKIYHIPQPNCWPHSGGVREHARQLMRHLVTLGIKSVTDPRDSDLIHVQTAYRSPNGRVDVFTCHGGFMPPPAIPQVLTNLRHAQTIISVAAWIVDAYFPEYKDKTVVIPNGVDLSEWENLPPSGIEPGYILWGKGFYREDWRWFVALAQARPDLRFVSTLSDGADLPSNMTVIGVQPQDKMRSLMNDCAVYVSTGSEVCPTMVLEAWAAGKPVLAWDGDGNRELLRYSEGGFLYEDLEEMCGGLDGLMIYGEAYGEVARKYVERHYQWSDLAQRTLEVYDRLC